MSLQNLVEGAREEKRKLEAESLRFWAREQD